MIERTSQEGQTVDEQECRGVRDDQKAEICISCQDEYLQACWGYDPSSVHSGAAAEDPRHTFLQRYLFLINKGRRPFLLHLSILKLPKDEEIDISTFNASGGLQDQVVVVMRSIHFIKGEYCTWNVATGKFEAP